MKFRVMFGAFRKGSAKVKVYLQRSLSWIGLLNSVMILYLMMSDLSERGVIGSLQKYVVLSIVVLAVGLLVFGYFEVKYGFMRAEYSAIWKNIPQVNEILNRLEAIENKLGEGRNEKT